MKVLITDDVHPLLIDELHVLGYAADYRPAITYPETLELIAGYDGLVVNSKIMCHEELLKRAEGLKWIARLGSGMEVIDTGACRQRGIKYFNTPEGNRNAVAEHALAMLLNLMDRICKANSEVKSSRWNREPNRGEELGGKTVGIIGFGNTGEAFAKVLRGFDVQVLAYDKYRKGFGGGQVKEAAMEDLFAEADVISLHLPLTDETRLMVDESFFDCLKKPVYLINTSRGKVMKTTALLSALGSGKVKAAGLDVLENEKISDLNSEEKRWFEELVKNEQVLLSPHIAGWTFESKKKIAELVALKVREMDRAV